MARLTAISLFTGGMGLDLGFDHEGFQIKVAVENDRWAIKTIEANRPGQPVIGRPIEDVPTEEILDKAELERGTADVVIGAPPCEPFSTAGRRNGFRDVRAEAVGEFIRVIAEARPRYFVMEEVPGFLRAAKRHISFYERARTRTADLDPDERLGSAFDEIMQKFEGTGYTLSYGRSRPASSVLNAADYGTPQKRKRFVLVGSRDGDAVSLPSPTHAAPGSSGIAREARPNWLTLRDALKDLDDTEPEHTEFPDTWRNYLDLVPAGGCWRDLPVELQEKALGGAYDDPGNVLTAGLKGGRTGFLRRLSWHKPAPTLVDRPTTKAGCLCHPDETRPLSVREYRRIQGFPDHWILCGPISVKYRLIGQATPIPLARAVAHAVLGHLWGYPAD